MCSMKTLNPLILFVLELNDLIFCVRNLKTPLETLSCNKIVNVFTLPLLTFLSGVVRLDYICHLSTSVSSLILLSIFENIVSIQSLSLSICLSVCLCCLELLASQLICPSISSLLLGHLHI